MGAAPAGAPASPAKSAPLKPAPAKPAVNEPASAPAEVAGNPPSAANASPAQQVGSPSLRRLADLPDLQEDAQPSPSPTSRAEFTTVYDILDKMENMLEEAKSSVFAPSIAKVDREEFIGALDDLKKMLPVQLERASALMRESERRLDAAQTQSNAIVSEAQSRAADVVKEAGEQAEFLAGQENVVAIAQRKAQAIIDQAQAQSDKLVQGANEYSAKVMEALGEQLGHYQQDVQAGIEVLREREREAASKLDQSYAEEQ
ncbi:cell division protein [Bombiscardovia apis]|uniref:cell division protein n=1 Tax=Bombiscardovia apis TaxID=2932182 RepID=UPI003CE565DD